MQLRGAASRAQLILGMLVVGPHGEVNGEGRPASLAPRVTAWPEHLLDDSRRPWDKSAHTVQFVLSHVNKICIIALHADNGAKVLLAAGKISLFSVPWRSQLLSRVSRRSRPVRRQVQSVLLRENTWDRPPVLQLENEIGASGVQSRAGQAPTTFPSNSSWARSRGGGPASPALNRAVDRPGCGSIVTSPCGTQTHSHVFAQLGVLWHRHRSRPSPRNSPPWVFA